MPLPRSCVLRLLLQGSIALLVLCAPEEPGKGEPRAQGRAAEKIGEPLPTPPAPHGGSRSREPRDIPEQPSGRDNARSRRDAGPARGPPRQLFGWGDFYCNVKTAKLNLLIAGKVLDHGNGTVSVFFQHNSTGRGNVSVSLVPPGRAVRFDAERQIHAEAKESKVFNCRVEREKVDRSRETPPCAHDPGRSCPREHTRGRAAWLCSQPFEVLCVFVTFYGPDYRLAQKVCPDYRRRGPRPYFPSG